MRNPVAAVADRLPRLLNLCRAAQGMAAKRSLGLPTTVDRTAEILRDHVWTLCITQPTAFGLDPAEAVWKRGGDVGGVGDRSISGYEVRKEGISRSPRLWEGDLTVSGRPDVAQDDVDQRCMASISPLTPSRATIRLML